MNPTPTVSGRPFRLVASLLLAPLLAFSLATSSAQDLSEQEEGEAPARSAEELEKLVAPIALYPDALVALILPAATVPTDVTLAARFLAGQNDPATIPAQPWDESVKALARYPEVVKWMDENLAWTRELGEAFAHQSSDVMNSVQRMRAKAQAAGTLKTTPEQEVVVREEVIYIEPAQPEVIYVPHYNCDVVYGPPPWGYAGPFISFGVGYPLGAWLSFDLDWHHRVLWRDRAWHRYDARWRHELPLVRVGPRPTPRPWHPPANHFRSPPRTGWRDGSIVSRPRDISEPRRLEANRPPRVSPRPDEQRDWSPRPFAEASPRVRGTRPRDLGGREAHTATPPAASAVLPARSASRVVPAAPSPPMRTFHGGDRENRPADSFSRRTTNPSATPSPVSRTPIAPAATPSAPRMAPAANPPAMRQDAPRPVRAPPAERGTDRERRDTRDKQR